MAIRFGREICGIYALATRREWLVTNGIGGYAAGTVSGTLTRRYHGVLMAALQPPVARTLLVSKLDDTVRYRGQDVPLFTNAWGADDVEADGLVSLESFRLEGSVPTWSYAFGDALLEKRIWMEQGENTTYIRYTLVRATSSVVISARAVVSFRDSHGNLTAGEADFTVERVSRGLKITPTPDAAPYYVLSDRADATPDFTWLHNFYMGVEAYRGLPPLDDHAYAGIFLIALSVGESVTFAATTRLMESIDGHSALAARRAIDAHLIAQSGLGDAPEWIRQLVLAADQFIVKRTIDGEPNGKTVIAGYHWFADWGRDTMIALPGLTLSTRRYGDAKLILKTFARFVDQGMLPNNFPDAGEAPGYNTVDATLWYFEAIRAYTEATGDMALVRELFPVLEAIIVWHERGTRYGIKVDAADGLLMSGEAGVQLTWMDVKIGDWVVTPRTGKAVEINALWYNALRIMADFARDLGADAMPYTAAAARVQVSFARFWNAETGTLYDVIDTPAGTPDASLRPNAIFAAALAYSPLTDEQARSVVDECAAVLLTSYGLRSLTPDHGDYRGRYGGDRVQRDSVYHQGTVWGWLIGAFAAAHLRVYHDKAAVRELLEPFADQLVDGCVGTLAEIFDGDPPYHPRGAVAQAWSVSEVLRAWRLSEYGRD